jgi:hypothetical protein
MKVIMLNLHIAMAWQTHFTAASKDIAMQEPMFSMQSVPRLYKEDRQQQQQQLRQS